jgi:amino acid adenylation domain-containing protein
MRRGQHEALRYLVSHLLDESARKTPDAPAVLDGEREITYLELERQSNHLANLLIDLGVRRGERVGIYLDKSIESVVAIYGTLKAGGAYVPLDPQAPPARLGYIVHDAGVRVLLTGCEKEDAWQALNEDGHALQSLVVLNGAPAAAPGGVRVLTTSDVAAASDSRPATRIVDCDLAYILYTSGSTGTPKGVMLTHRNCLAFVEWAVEEFAVCAEDRLSSHAPLHFDLSTFDLFAAAAAGAAVALVPAQASVFPGEIRRFIEDAGITVWYSVPSILSMLVIRGGLKTGALPKLRTVLFAGEVFPTGYLKRLVELLPEVRFANLYGPTETNVCTWWEVIELPEHPSETIPIGRAIANVDTFIVTDEGRLAERGEVGELYVRGPTVMQGYLGDPEKTASRLVPAPFGDIRGQLVYRTGDLVREAPSGDYHFLGRRDNQVKSRGYRIELGDVEAAIQAHPAVTECAVVAVADEMVGNRLYAFVAAREEAPEPPLGAFCAERIPGYMIPERFEVSDALPRTSTGKVDRPALIARVSPGASGP